MHVPDSDSNAHDRLVRNTARLAAGGGLIYGLLLAPRIAAQSGYLPWWWTVVAVTTIFGSAAAIVLASYRGSPAMILRTVTAHACAYLLGIVSWPLYSDVDALTEQPWVSNSPGIVCLATATVWRPATVAGYLVLVYFLSSLIDVRQAPLHVAGWWFPEWVAGCLFSALFVAAGVGVVRSGRILDETAKLARSRTAAAAAAEARATERRRFDALTHDGVMATLLGAARSANSPLLSGQAGSTLAQLDRLRAGVTDSDPLDADAIRARLRAAVSDGWADVVVEFAESGDASGLVVPAEIGRAMCAAATEAVRNVRRHAGADARCLVHLDLGPDHVQVDIVDDGHGFDPGSVPPQRLGLRVTVEGGFGELPGAWARIDSARDVGTRVTLGWRQR